MDDDARHRWIATHVLPYGGEVRGWLRRYVYTLSEPDADDVVQEAYARLWLADLPAIQNSRAYLYMVVRNLVIYDEEHVFKRPAAVADSIARTIEWMNRWVLRSPDQWR